MSIDKIRQIERYLNNYAKDIKYGVGGEERIDEKVTDHKIRKVDV